MSMYAVWLFEASLSISLVWFIQPRRSAHKEKDSIAAAHDLGQVTALLYSRLTTSLRSLAIIIHIHLHLQSHESTFSTIFLLLPYVYLWGRMQAYSRLHCVKCNTSTRPAPFWKWVTTEPEQFLVLHVLELNFSCMAIIHISCIGGLLNLDDAWYLGYPISKITVNIASTTLGLLYWVIMASGEYVRSYQHYWPP